MSVAELSSLPFAQILGAAAGVAAGATALAASIVPPLSRRILPEPKETRLADFLPFEAILPDGMTVVCKDRTMFRIVSIEGFNLRFLPLEYRENLFRTRKKWLDDLSEMNISLRIYQMREAIDGRRPQNQEAFLLRSLAETWEDQFERSYRDEVAILIAVGPGSNQSQRLEDAVSTTLGNLAQFGAKILTQEGRPPALSHLLGRIVSPITKPWPMGVGGYLSESIDADIVEFEPNGDLVIWRPSATEPDGKEKLYCAVIGMKALGEYSDEDAASELAAMPYEYIICSAIEPQPKTQALLALKARQQMLSTTSLGSGAAVEAIQASVDMVEGSDQVISMLHKFTQFVIVRGRTRDELEDAVGACRQILNLRGITAVREEGTAQASFFLQFPCFKLWPRVYDLHSNNVAHFAPFNSPPKGHQRSDFGPGPIARFRTSENSIYDFIFHESSSNDAVGHGLVIAPTGSGKTVLVSFLDAMAARHRHLRSFLFDRLDGLYVYTSAANGAYFNLQTEHKPLSTEVGMNPLQCQDALENRAFLRQFIRLLTGLSDQDSTEQIANLIDIAFALPAEMRSLKMLHRDGAIPPNSVLWKEMLRWIDDDQYGSVFNAPEDSLGFGGQRVATFDMTRIFEDDMLAPAVTSYITHRVKSYLRETREPALIFIDEAARILQNPMFRTEYLIALEEFRKRGGAVLSAFQTPASLEALGIGERIRQACKTWYLFPNGGAKRQDYEAFSLTDAEWNFICGELRLPDNHRGVLIKRPETRESVVVDIDFRVLGDHLKILNSGRRAVAIACDLQRKHGRDWGRHYLNSEI